MWEARYLAYPGGLKLPLILADVSILVAGGYRQVFRKSRAALMPERAAIGPLHDGLPALPAVRVK